MLIVFVFLLYGNLASARQYVPECAESWYYSCKGGCNATQDKRLDDPKYNRELCSRVTDVTEEMPVTFPNLKSLYKYICSLSGRDQDKLGCLFDSSNVDLSTSPLFNYRGPCKNDVSAVSCEGGAKAIQADVFFRPVPECPPRHTPIPFSPAIGQPVGQDWPFPPWCMHNPFVSYYKNGNFYLSMDDGTMHVTYPL